MAAAQEKESTKGDRNILTCTICDGELKKPKLLPCQHSFCTECLVQRFADRKEGQPFCCPICHLDIGLSDKTVGGLPGNYLYEIIQDAFSKECTSEAKCIPCTHDNKTTNATHKCLDCGDTLCQCCNTWHCKFTATRHHVVVAIADLRDGKFQDELSKRKVLYCTQHSAKEHRIPLSSFCETCSCLVCVDCTQNAHKGHTFTKFHAERRNQQRECEERIKTLEMSQKDQDRRIGTIKMALKKTKEMWGQQETDIYNTATSLYALVDKVKEEKLNELKSLYDKEIKFLNDLLDQETSTGCSLQATIAFTKKFVEKSSDSDFLYHNKDIRTRMEKSQQRPSQDAKRSLVVFKKEDTDSVKEGLGHVFGGIQTQRHFLHKGIIGHVKEMFRRKVELDEICGLSYDAKHNEILLIDEKSPKINICTKDGNFKRSVPLENTPSDIHTKDGQIYITTSKKNLRQVIVMDEDGHVERKLRIPNDDQTTNGKLSIAVAEDNTVFIASANKNRIYKWLPGDEDNMAIIASQDNGIKLSDRHFICTTPCNEVVVLNNRSPDYSDKVQIYSKEGKLKWQHESESIIDRYINRTSHDKHKYGKEFLTVCSDEDGYIYVVINHNHYDSKIMVLYNEKVVGQIPIIINDRKLKKEVPLISTPDGDLIYGDGKDLVKLSFWE